MSFTNADTEGARTEDTEGARTEAELVQDQKSKTRRERVLRFTKDRNKYGDRIKAVGVKPQDDTMVEDEEYGILNLKRIRSLRDLQ